MVENLPDSSARKGVRDIVWPLLPDGCTPLVLWQAWTPTQPPPGGPAGRRHSMPGRTSALPVQLRGC